MADFTTTETCDRSLTYHLAAASPQGAAIGALRTMLTVVDRKLVTILGPELATADDVAWVLPWDGEIRVRIPLPEPSHGRRCGQCTDTARYLLRETQEPLCANHAAARAAAGERIAKYPPQS